MQSRSRALPDPRRQAPVVDTVLAGLDRKVRAATLARGTSGGHDLTRLRNLAAACRAYADMVDHLVGPAPVQPLEPVRIPFDCDWR